MNLHVLGKLYLLLLITLYILLEIKRSGIINIKIASLLKGVDSVWTSELSNLYC